MATTEKNGILSHIDGDGNVCKFYPVTKVGNVEGLDDKFKAELSVKADATAVSSPYNFKGACAFSELPTTGNAVNDTYYCTDLKTKYTWNGTAWYPSSLNEAAYLEELNKKVSTEEQTLTDEQMAQARSNIGAASQKETNDAIKSLIYQEASVDATWEKDTLNPSTGENYAFNNNYYMRTAGYISAKDVSGTIATISTEKGDGVTPYIFEYRADKSFIQRTIGQKGAKVTPVSEECEYIRIVGYSTTVSQTDIPSKIKIYFHNDKSIEWLYEKTNEHNAAIASSKTVSNTALNLFRNKKHFSHLFIDKSSGGENDIIPCQSIHDIAIASRLGFHVAEANCHKVLDASGNSRYITMHGASGAIGRQIVLKKYVDHAYGNATEEDTDGTLKFANEALLISEQTFEALRENYVYWSKYQKYRTRITTLEEFLLECKKYSIIPLVQYVDDEQIQFVKKYVGEDFILYANQRHGFDGMVFAWAGANPTANNVLNVCDAIGAPMVVSFSLTENSTLADDDLRTIIDGVHERGCLIGFASCYTRPPIADKLFNMGVDLSSSSSYVNDFDSGDIVNATADISFDDFATTGTVEDNVLKLSVGDTVTIDGLTARFLAKGSLHIRYSGTIGLDLGHYIRYAWGHTFTSDGTSTSWFSTYFMEAAPTFTITAVSETEIYMLNYKASKC